MRRTTRRCFQPCQTAVDSTDDEEDHLDQEGNNEEYHREEEDGDEEGDPVEQGDGHGDWRVQLEQDDHDAEETVHVENASFESDDVENYDVDKNDDVETGETDVETATVENAAEGTEKQEYP